jgi:hypothetical protein
MPWQPAHPVPTGSCCHTRTSKKCYTQLRRKLVKRGQTHALSAAASQPAIQPLPPVVGAAYARDAPVGGHHQDGRHVVLKSPAWQSVRTGGQQRGGWMQRMDAATKRGTADAVQQEDTTPQAHAVQSSCHRRTTAAPVAIFPTISLQPSKSLQPCKPHAPQALHS